jgi:electron transport complex protein RnfB
MDVSLIWKAVLALTGLGLLFGVLLAVAFSRFRVEVDERVEEVLAALPGSNCGACGLPGCEAAAEAVVNGEAPASVCKAGGPDVAEAVARIMGVQAERAAKQVAHIRCRGGESVSPKLAFYEGVNSCRGAELAAGGGKACPFGCLGLEDCAKACPINAISFDEEGIRRVKVKKCTGCGLCADVCPRDLIKMVPAKQKVLVRCNSHYTGKKAVSLCKIACIGCKKCEKICDFDAIHVEDGIALIDFEKCTDCGECAVVCPTDSIQVWTQIPGHPEKGEFVIPPRARQGEADETVDLEMEDT